jgi:hypothetical protein
MAFVITVGLSLSMLQSEATVGPQCVRVYIWTPCKDSPNPYSYLPLAATATPICNGSHFQTVKSRMAQRRYISHQWCPDRLWIF